MPKFHYNCKDRFERYCVLLKKHDDIIGLAYVQDMAETLSAHNKCGYCERSLKRYAPIGSHLKVA
jgi:hypothetical protein